MGAIGSYCSSKFAMFIVFGLKGEKLKVKLEVKKVMEESNW